MIPLDELKQIADAVGTRQGWNFSRVRDERDPVPWHYDEGCPPLSERDRSSAGYWDGRWRGLFVICQPFCFGSWCGFRPRDG